MYSSATCRTAGLNIVCFICFSCNLATTTKLPSAVFGGNSKEKVELEANKECTPANTFYFDLREDTVEVDKKQKVVSDGAICVIWRNYSNGRRAIDRSIHNCKTIQLAVEGINDNMLYRYGGGAMSPETIVNGPEEYTCFFDFRRGGTLKENGYPDNGRLWGLENGVYLADLYWNNRMILDEITLEYTGEDTSRLGFLRQRERERFIEKPSKMAVICGEKYDSSAARRITNIACQESEERFVKETAVLPGDTGMEEIWFLLKVCIEKGWWEAFLALAQNINGEKYINCSACRLVDILEEEGAMNERVIRELCRNGLLLKQYDLYEIASYGYKNELLSMVQDCGMNPDAELIFNYPHMGKKKKKLTAIAVAAAGNDWDTIEMLLGVGATSGKIEESGMTSLEIAAERCSYHALKILLEKGKKDRTIEEIESAERIAEENRCTVEARYLNRQLDSLRMEGALGDVP